jgi:hypothetical protein
MLLHTIDSVVQHPATALQINQAFISVPIPEKGHKMKSNCRVEIAF